MTGGTGLPREQLGAILESVGEGITAFDAGGRLVYANDAAARLSGYPDAAAMLAAPRGEWATRFELLRDDGSPLPLEELPTRRAFTSDGRCEAIVRWRSLETGADRWTLISASAVRGTDGAVRQVISIFRDVTERVRRRIAEDAIARATALLATSRDTETTLRALAQAIVPGLADYCIIHASDARTPLRIVAHVDPEQARTGTELQRKFPPAREDAVHGTQGVLRTGEPELIETITDDVLVSIAVDDDHLERLRGAGLRSSITVPMRGHQGIEGALALLVSSSGRRFEAGDMELAQELADRAGAFLANARLTREAREARDRAEAQARRLHLIAKSSRAFAEAGMDVQEVLETVAREMCAVIGEGCAIRTLSEDGTMNVHRASVVSDPEIAALATHPALIAPRPRDVGYFGEVLRTGERVVVPVVDRDALLAQYRAVGLAGHLARMVPKTAAFLPLRAGGAIFGVVALSRFREAEPYDADELALCEELAHLAALALENARLYRDARRAEAERAELLERERDASRAKDEFLAMLGHELRNPLSPILGIVQLHRMQPGGAVPERHLEILERQTLHLVRLVDDLLDVSRITRGKIVLDRRSVRVHDAVQKGLEMKSALVQSRAHVLTVDVPAELTLAGDEQRLAQVIANLVGNAAKYTPEGGHISVRAAREGGSVVIRVRDDGMGIPCELVPRMFDVFVQGARGVDRAEGGLGLGLAIVRTIVELHGGRVSAHSEGVGRGAELVVELPAEAEEPPATERGEQAQAPVETSASRRVLVVDDNADGAEMVVTALELAGHTAFVAHDAPSALELARALPLDVALLDIGLPGMDGCDLARALRALPGHERIGLIAMTGYGQPSDRARTEAAGFEAHLVKPVDFEALATLLGSDRA